MDASHSRTLVRVPDAWTSVVFRRPHVGTPDIVVIGPRVQASYHADKDVHICAKVRLHAGTVEAVLGVAAGEVVQRAVPLGLLWAGDADRLAERLAASGSDPEEARRLLAAGLRARLPQASPRALSRARLARRAAVELLTPDADGALPSVAGIARRLSVSERQLRAVFLSAVGVPPKRFTSIQRVRAVVADRRRPLAELASSVGYYDQAHLTADFRAAMGVTPGAFRAGRLPRPTGCLG